MTSAGAIRDFVAYAYANWSGAAPGYLLLLGDGTYDMRHYLTSSGQGATTAPTYIPPLLAMVDPYIGETAADNRFVSIVGNDAMPDMNSGRLPANSAAEAEIMVDKILDYELLSPPGDWDKNVLFIADELSLGGGNFYELSDVLADGYDDPPANTIKYLPAGYTSYKVYMETPGWSYPQTTCAYESPSIACKQDIINTINQRGTLLVSYVGHSTKTYWGTNRMFDEVGLSQLTNGDMLPVFLAMSCVDGAFHQPEVGAEAFAEMNVRMAGGGSIASWSGTGWGLAFGHDYLERGFLLGLFHDGAESLGAATTAGKLYLVANTPPGAYDDLLETYLILGDPGLEIDVAQP
jgi:hypothetical protein